MRANRKAFEVAMEMSVETKEIIMGTAERLGWFEEINKKY